VGPCFSGQLPDQVGGSAATVYEDVTHRFRYSTDGTQAAISNGWDAGPEVSDLEDFVCSFEEELSNFRTKRRSFHAHPYRCVSFIIAGEAFDGCSRPFYVFSG